MFYPDDGRVRVLRNVGSSDLEIKNERISATHKYVTQQQFDDTLLLIVLYVLGLNKKHQATIKIRKRK